jgi:hypothetical protein
VKIVVATPAPSFVTGKALGALRNDYTVGFRMTVETQPLTVTSLGRIFFTGNSGTHNLEIVRASDNAVVASVNINMSGGTANQFKYASLSSAVTLSANTSYYLVSLETAAGANAGGSRVQVLANHHTGRNQSFMNSDHEFVSRFAGSERQRANA